jgi:hypothetical protein
MSYQLVLSEPIDENIGPVFGDKDFGTNVFFDNLPSDCQVYVLYYPGISLNRDLANKLKSLGNIAGRNLFVNIAKLDDPKFQIVVSKFRIKTFPTMIITAIDKLASPPEEFSTAYVKIEDKKLLSSTDLAFECIQKIFNLFIDGKISEAVRENNREVRNVRIKAFLNNALGGVQGFLKDWEINFDFLSGRLGLKYKGG